MGPASPPSSDRDSWCTASSGSITPDELQPGVPLAPLQIFVKTAHSETLAVTVEASETFDNVKAKLHAREGLSPNQLCLISVDSVCTSLQLQHPEGYHGVHEDPRCEAGPARPPESR